MSSSVVILQTKLAVPTHEARIAQTAFPFLREKHTDNTAVAEQQFEKSKVKENKQLNQKPDLCFGVAVATQSMWSPSESYERSLACTSKKS